MPRRPRALTEPGLFHVTSRGNNRRPVFVDVPDRQVYLAKLEQAAARSRWSILSWCQLENHHHLLVRSDAGALSRGMQWLNGGYAMHFNRRHGCDGHLWDGRFKAKPVTDDAHLWMTLGYIARNPVDAGCSATPDGWMWSSHRSLAGARERDIVAAEELLGLLDEELEVARRRYEQLAGTASPDRAHEPSLWRPTVEELFARHARELAAAIAIIDYAYGSEEIAEVVDASDVTVRRWMRAGRKQRQRGQ